MSEGGIEPIIVVGKSRSGTKWLTNIICNHRHIFGVQSKRARGVIETDLFRELEKKFDLRYPDDYAAFIEMWSESEFFIESGGRKEMYYSIPARPRSFYEIFSMLMNDRAKNSRADYWVQKVSPRFARPVLRSYPSAHLILIRRNPRDVIASTYAAQVRYGGSPRLGGIALEYIYQARLMDNLESSYPSAHSVSFERLQHDKEDCVRELCAHIGVDFDQNMLEDRFSPNTSFGSNTARDDIFSPSQTIRLKALLFFFTVIPFWIIQWAYDVKEGRHRTSHFVFGSFGRHKEKLKDKKIYA